MKHIIVFFNFIKSLLVNLTSLSLKHQQGDNATVAKIKTKNNTGDIAGRDIIKNTYAALAIPEEAPYVCAKGSFGGNGVILHFMGCGTQNLSDQFVILERIDILGRSIRFNDYAIEAGETASHTGINDLEYPDSDTERFLEIYFKTKNNKQFVARQQLEYQRRQDGKFEIIGLAGPQITSLAQ